MFYGIVLQSKASPFIKHAFHAFQYIKESQTAIVCS